MIDSLQLTDTAVIQYFTKGGAFMWLILAISFLAMAIGVERYLALRFRFWINGRRLFNDVKKFVTANDWRRAQEICRQYAAVPLAQVLGAGLAHADQPIEEMETAMESQTLYYVPKINNRLNYLSTLANVATLVGLLGTIAGLIKAFAALGVSAEAGISQQEALSGGIATAMFTTAFGLIVAIPALLAHMYLTNRANQIIDDIDHYATSLKQLIQRLRSKGVQIHIQDQEISVKTTNEAQASIKSTVPETSNT